MVSVRTRKISITAAYFLLFHCSRALKMSSVSGGWSALQKRSNEILVGKALSEDAMQRSVGKLGRLCRL